MSRAVWSGNRPETEYEAERRICTAAFACFKRKGIGRTTMSDVAREAGITRPTLYKYFRNKGDLLLTAIDREALDFAQAVVNHTR